jgi:competence protein ComEC
VQLVRNFIVNAGIALLAISCVGTALLFDSTQFGKLRIIFMDIGQGDSFLISTPDHYNLLVDAGRDARAKEKLDRILAPWERLHGVLLTHPDADHVGALGQIVASRNVATAFANEINHENAGYREFTEVVAAQSQREPVYRGDIWRIGCCVMLEVVWPTSTELAATDSDPNHLSTAFVLRFGRFALFAAGDLESEVEDDLANRLPRDFTALKVGHHGSNTSSSAEFLQDLSPELAVIQVGENTYGHPTAGVLANLAAVGVKTFRNDLHGDITLTTDGENYFINTER